VSFDHLITLSDDTGLFEHARGVIPRREHGYCLDDVARGLVVLSREPQLTPPLIAIASTYMAFVAHAQDSSGRCHNRLGYDRRWKDEAGVDDCWGRAVWGLGSLAASEAIPALQTAALDTFEVSAACRSPWLRATAFSALGAVAVLERYPQHQAARDLLSDAIPILGRPARDRAWPWPEPRLTYANASIADAMIGAGQVLGDHRAVSDGMNLLAWLFEVQTFDGHLSPIPVGGWAAGEPRPAFDQQPIEVSALAEAAARAFALSGEVRWSSWLQDCVDWFTGDNDSGIALYDPHTGGGFDGLESGGRNANQGAESTLAALVTMQLARACGGHRC
jgi:hypothetical protein